MRTISKTLLLTSIVAAITFAGCKKEDTPEPTPPTPNPVAPTIASLNAFFTDNGAQSQFFTINNNSTQTITGNQGTFVGFNANTFVTLSGAPVTGNITIELREIYDKKTMLLSNVGTNAVHYPGGPKGALISGGEYYVNAKQGSSQLKLGPGQTYSVFLPSATAPNASMSLFDGEMTPDGILWAPNTDSMAYILPSSAPQGYFATCDSLYWGNADVFWSNVTETTITMNISGTFDPAQIKAYVWYDNVNILWTCWDAFNSTANTFTETYTASGVPAHLVVISVKDGVLYTAILGTTTSANGVYNLTMTASDETTFTNELTALQ